jgi:hypothetical protein
VGGAAGGGAGGLGPNNSNSHQISLKLLLEQLGIKPARLHNAGGVWGEELLGIDRL